jgi:hypothetical protein
MPKKKSIEHARQDEREGKAPSTQAGEFVREEIELIRGGVHGARSTKQAIAIGLSKARRAGVKLPPPKKGTVSEETREKAKRDLEKAALWRTIWPTHENNCAGSEFTHPGRR